MKKSILMFSALFVLFNSILEGQNNAPPPLPQRIATATVISELSFGDITLESISTGGTVSVTPTGVRNYSGSVVLMNLGLSAFPAELAFKLCPGRSIKVLYDPIYTLSNGTHSMNFAIDDIQIGTTTITNSGQSFTSNKGCNDTHVIKVGATLTVGPLASNSRGLYTGEFEITLAQE